MKKLIISAIIASLLIPMTAFGAFNDVDSSTDYNNAIQWMADNGVIKGYPDGSFQPDRCVNRAELVKMVIEVSEQHLTPPPVNGNRYYPDVQQSDWFYGYIMNASNRGWVQGYPNGTFKPGNCVNRVEAIKIAILALNNGQTPGTPSGKATFNKPYDVDSSAWYFNYIMKAVNEDTIGLLHATYGGGATYKYYPADSITRKEVAEMLYRMKAVKDKNASIYNTNLKPNTISQQSILSYNGPAQFKLDFNTIPCSEYAYDSAICSNDPNASVETSRFYLILDTNNTSSELSKYLNGNTVNVGCVDSFSMYGDLYTYEKNQINLYFYNNQTKSINFEINTNQPARGDITCLSTITKVNSVE